MWKEDIWVTTELSSFCNLSCPHCSQHNPFLKKKGFMSREIFTKIVDDFVKNKIKINNINPFYRGESLLNPDFPFFIDYLLKKSKEFCFFDFLVLHTNGIFLNDENIKKILEISDQKVLPHPNDLFISIDASEPKVYKIMKGNTGFEKVISNIDKLLRQRKKKNQFGPNIVFQFVVCEKNYHQMADFYFLIKKIYNKYYEKKLNIKHTMYNEPWRVEDDTVYYRCIETKSYDIDDNLNIFKRGLINLNKVGIIK